MNEDEYKEREALFHESMTNSQMRDFAHAVDMEYFYAQSVRLREYTDKFEKMDHDRFDFVGTLYRPYLDALHEFNCKRITFGEYSQKYLEAAESDRSMVLSEFEIYLSELVSIVDKVLTNQAYRERFTGLIRKCFEKGAQEQIDAIWNLWTKRQINDSVLMERMAPIFEGFAFADELIELFMQASTPFDPS